jgi:hypothetical protein
VTYKAIVFRVFRNEVIDAVVSSIDSLGFRCNAGPLSIFVYKDVCCCVCFGAFCAFVLFCILLFRFLLVSKFPRITSTIHRRQPTCKMLAKRRLVWETTHASRLPVGFRIPKLYVYRLTFVFFSSDSIVCSWNYQRRFPRTYLSSMTISRCQPRDDLLLWSHVVLRFWILKSNTIAYYSFEKKKTIAAIDKFSNVQNLDVLFTLTASFPFFFHFVSDVIFEITCSLIIINMNKIVDIIMFKTQLIKSNSFLPLRRYLI